MRKAYLFIALLSLTIMAYSGIYKYILKGFAHVIVAEAYGQTSGQKGTSPQELNDQMDLMARDKVLKGYLADDQMATYKINGQDFTILLNWKYSPQALEKATYIALASICHQIAHYEKFKASGSNSLKFDKSGWEAQMRVWRASPDFKPGL